MKAKALEALRTVHEGSNQSWIRRGAREALSEVEAAEDGEAVQIASKALDALGTATADRAVKRIVATFNDMASAAGKAARAEGEAFLTATDSVAESGKDAASGMKLQLFSVMSPWHSSDAEQGTFEETVWAQGHEQACRELAARMADTSVSGCESDEERAAWIERHLDAVKHLMAVVPVAETAISDLRTLLEGPTGSMTAEVVADFEVVMGVLRKYAKL